MCSRKCSAFCHICALNDCSIRVLALDGLAFDIVCSRTALHRLHTNMPVAQTHTHLHPPWPYQAIMSLKSTTEKKDVQHPLHTTTSYQGKEYNDTSRSVEPGDLFLSKMVFEGS